MPLYFFKPVVWNTSSYTRPSGAQFTSGYPAEHGFGHEEWNNSDRLKYRENGKAYRVFHTEAFGNQPLTDYAGEILLFMIASHGERQYLVAVAGQATALFDEENARRHLVELLRLDQDDKRRQQAWGVPSVQRAYNNDSGRFQREWRNELRWFPTWKCPADFYLGLRNPVALDARQLTGKNALIKRYGSYQEIDRATAQRVLGLIPASENQNIVRNLKALCQTGADDISIDIARIVSKKRNDPTSRKALIDARLGQGRFRDDVAAIWGHTCAVTGWGTREVLQASHVKPWRKCTDRERLDPENGILLGAHLHALFDAGLISFGDGGGILVSSRLGAEERNQMGLSQELRKQPSPQLTRYLRYHRRAWGLCTM